MSPPADRLPPLLSDLIITLVSAVPARVRRTFLDLLLGAALTTAGHVTTAILKAGLSRSWTTYLARSQQSCHQPPFEARERV